MRRHGEPLHGQRRRQRPPPGHARPAASEQYLWPIWTPDGDKIVDRVLRATQLARRATCRSTPRPAPDAVRAQARRAVRLQRATARGARPRALGLPGRRSRCSRADGSERSAVRADQRLRLHVALARRPLRRRPSTAATATAAIDVIVWDLQTKHEAQPHQRPVRRLQRATRPGRRPATGSSGAPTRTAAARPASARPTSGRSARTARARRRSSTARRSATTTSSARRAAAPRRRARPGADARGAASPTPRVGGAPPAPRARQIALDASASKPGADGAAIAVLRVGPRRRRRLHRRRRARTPKAQLPRRGHLPRRRARHRRQRPRRDGDRRGDGRPTPRPAISGARVDDGDPASFSATVTDAGRADVADREGLLGRLRDRRDRAGDRAGDGYVVIAQPPGATSVKLVVSDGDGGGAEATATRVLAPANAPPSADDASADGGRRRDGRHRPARRATPRASRSSTRSSTSRSTAPCRCARRPAPDRRRTSPTRRPSTTGTDTFTYRVKRRRGRVARSRPSPSTSQRAAGRSGRVVEPDRSARSSPPSRRSARPGARGRQAGRPARRRGRHGRRPPTASPRPRRSRRCRRPSAASAAASSASASRRATTAQRRRCASTASA